jgi:hypothetical protein
VSARWHRPRTRAGAKILFSQRRANQYGSGMQAVKPAGLASFAALGVVFGDLGTSPLYTLQTVVQATGGHFTPASALGILSSIIWTLLLTVSLKYSVFVMRADNHGEGGILALMSLIGANGFATGFKILTGMGLLGAALIYGDGVITPAISVLSALEGINVVTASFKPFVMPIAVAILIGLFAAQRFGTRSAPRDRLPAALGCAGNHGARRRISVHHRRRGIVRRHGALRSGADSAGMVRRRPARAVAELRRPDGLSHGQGFGDR